MLLPFHFKGCKTGIKNNMFLYAQDIDVLCIQPNEIAQNAVEPIFLASLRRLARNMGSTAF